MLQRTLNTHPAVPAPQLANPRASLPAGGVHILHSVSTFACPLGKVSKNTGHSLFNPETAFLKPSHPKAPSGPPPSGGPAYADVPLIFALVFRLPHWSLTEFPGPAFVFPRPSSSFPPKEALDSWEQLAFNCSKLKQLNKGGNVC